MKKLLFLALFLLIFTVFISHQKAEGRLLNVNLEKMTQIAGDIIAGKCVNVKPGFHPEYENVKVTFIEIETFDVIKGDGGHNFKFMQFGHGSEIAHLTKYKKNEKLLLFLYPKSRYGLTSPVGGAQGRLAIIPDLLTGKPKHVEVFNYKEFLKNANVRSLRHSENGATLIDYKILRNIIADSLNKSKKNGDNK